MSVMAAPVAHGEDKCGALFSDAQKLELHSAKSTKDLRLAVAQYAVANNLPAYAKPVATGLIPVILIRKKNVDRAAELMRMTFGTQFVHQTGDPTDHGMLRVRDMEIDLDTPGERTFGEINNNGLSWKGVSPYLKHRSDYDTYAFFEIMYKPSEHDLTDIEYY